MKFYNIHEWANKKGIYNNFLAKQIITRLDEKSLKYIPHKTGNLQASRRFPKHNQIYYTAPYSRYLWYGMVMIGPAPKIATNRPLHFKKGRCAKWFLKAKDEFLPNIIARVIKT